MPLVKKLSSILTIPVSVKVRILPSGDSLSLYQDLYNAGASLLTIHGRTRLQKGPLTGQADWNIVKQAVQRFPNIPILCNGSMCNLSEIRACLEYTHCDGVMCSEALLEYPPIYTECTTTNKRVGPGRLEIARQYLTLAREYPPQEGGQASGLKCLKAHLHRFLHADMQRHSDIREGVAYAKSLEELETMLNQLEKLYEKEGHAVEDEQLSWYWRHRVIADEETGKTMSEAKSESEGYVRKHELMEDAADCMACLFEGDGDVDGGDY